MFDDLPVNSSLVFNLSGQIIAEEMQTALPMRGELGLLVEAPHPDGTAGLKMRWFRLYSSEADGSRSRQGSFNILGLRGFGVATPSLALDLELRLFQTAAPLQVYPGNEPAESGFAVFKGSLRGDQEPGGEIRLVFAPCRLSLSEGRLFSRIDAFDMRLAPAEGRVIAPVSTANVRSEVTAAPATLQRRLSLQPIQFGAYQNQPATGGNWGLQLGTAKMVWGKCCILIDAAPLCTCTNDALRDSDDPTKLATCLPGSIPANTIPVFMVDKSLGDSGGKRDLGTGIIVLSSDSQGNPALLAHEIGHILNGNHPDSTGSLCKPTPMGFWNADPCTVLTPSGSAMSPCPLLNTDCNCKNAEAAQFESIQNCIPHPDPLPDDCDDDSSADDGPARLRVAVSPRSPGPARRGPRGWAAAVPRTSVDTCSR